MRRIGLRSAVAALVLAIVAPLTILGVIGVQRTWRRQLASLNRQNIATVRAMSVAVDQEVQGTSAALTVVGELYAADAPDLPAFERIATRLLPFQPTWSALFLSDMDGTLLDGVPDKRDGGVRRNASDAARTPRFAQVATVSTLFDLPDVPGHFLIVSVPIMHDGHVAFVLGARVKSDAFTAILQRQEAPPNGAVALVDGQGAIVARTKEEESFVGTRVTQAFADLIAQTDEGSWRAQGRDGTPNYAAFSRSPHTGLTVSLGLPTEEIDGPLRRLVWILSAAWLVVIGAGAGLGFLLGGALVRSLSAASRASLALAADEEITLPASRIAEIDDLAVGLRKAAATVQAHNRAHDQAARVKDEFLMTVSHELRTPLTAIVGWARMLSTGQVRDSQHPRAINAIERNANALHQLVNDLLDVSRIVSGHLRLDIRPLSIAEVVNAAIDSVGPAANAKGVAVSVELDDGLTVRGDAGRLQQVVWNLLSNAVKFTPAGGRIDVHTERIGRDMVLTVRDTGSGIAASFLPHVFDRFRQADTGTTRVQGGLGLGLAIVRHLVELHGGTVSVANNDPLPGSTFQVRLPCVAQPEGRLVRRIGSTPAAPPVRLNKLHLLVVDDDAQARELFTTILEHAGARVRAAASADDAIALLAAEWPDVLLSDIEMPNEDGYTMLRRARALHADRVLPAIAVTAHARPDDQARAIDSGFTWHLAKPVEPDELVKVVAMVNEQAGLLH